MTKNIDFKNIQGEEIQKSDLLVNNIKRDDLNIQNINEQKWQNWIDNVQKVDLDNISLSDEIKYANMIDLMDKSSWQFEDTNVKSKDLKEDINIDLKIFKPAQNRKIFRIYKKLLNLYLYLYLEKVTSKKSKIKIYRLYMEKIILNKEDNEDNKGLHLYIRILGLQLKKLMLKQIINIKKNKKNDTNVYNNENEKIIYLSEKILDLQLNKFKSTMDEKAINLFNPELNCYNYTNSDKMEKIEEKLIDKYIALITDELRNKMKMTRKKLYSKDYQDHDDLRRSRNMRTIFKGQRYEDIKKSNLVQYHDKSLEIFKKKTEVKSKIISFLKYSLLTPDNSEKFSMLFTNIRLNTFQAGIFKGGHRFFKLVSITPRHKRFIYIILCGFIIILFALLSKFYQILIQEEKRHYLDNEEYYIKSLDIENFYFFFNKYFKDFFLNNKILKLLQLGYTMDNYQDLYLIDLYNINCLYEWDPLYIQLHFNKLLTLEADRVRPKTKVLSYKSKFKKKLILYWLTNPNFRPCWTLNYYNLKFNNYTGSFFDLYCLFEYLSEEFKCNFFFFNGTLCYNYLFNSFNAEFFNKYHLYKANFYNPKKKIYRLYKLKNKFVKILSLKKSSLLTIIKKVEYILKFINLKFKLKKYIFKIYKWAKMYLYFIKRKIYKQKLKIKMYYQQYIIPSFNYIIPLHKFSITLPYTFFVLYTFYCLYYRRLRYSYYIRNHPWLNEYTSVKQYFTLANHKAGDNKWKLFSWKFWKNWKLQTFHFSKKKFTKKFNLFSLELTKRDYYLDYDTTVINYTFNVLNTTSVLDFSRDMKDPELELMSIIQDFTDYVIQIPYLSDFNSIRDKWYFFMRFKSVYKFFFANTDYGPDISNIINIMYSESNISMIYYNFVNFRILYQSLINLYFDHFQHFFFLRDLMTYNNKNLFKNIYKLSYLYLNIIYFSVYAINPKILWHLDYISWPLSKNYFVDFVYEMSFYIFFFMMDNLLTINVQHFLMQLRWHWNISYYYMYYNYKYFIANNIVDLINKNRLKMLWLQMCFFFKEEQINIPTIYKDIQYYESLKDFFFILLSRNIHYILLCFFLDLENSYFFYNNYNNYFFKDLQFYWNTTLSYRYAAYNNLCTFEYYKNWYKKPYKLFDLWIYYKDNKHEGRYCYRENLNVIF